MPNKCLRHLWVKTNPIHKPGLAECTLSFSFILPFPSQNHFCWLSTLLSRSTFLARLLLSHLHRVGRGLDPTRLCSTDSGRWKKKRMGRKYRTTNTIMIFLIIHLDYHSHGNKGKDTSRDKDNVVVLLKLDLFVAVAAFVFQSTLSPLVLIFPIGLKWRSEKTAKKESSLGWHKLPFLYLYNEMIESIIFYAITNTYEGSAA